jgi:hypothetical protein
LRVGLKKYSTDLSPWLRLMFFIGGCLLVTPVNFASDAIVAATPEPKLVTGTLYESGSDQKKILFTFQRTATNSGPTTRVERKFIRPDGFVAVMENAVYESGQLVSYDMKEFQANVWGDIQISFDQKKPARKKISINYRLAADAKKNAGQNLPPDTLIDDNIYPYMLSHWDALMHGDSVKFRLVSLEHETTFGFRFVKESEITLHGLAMVRIKMEPTSLLVSRLIDPLYFTIEKEGAHRIAGYTGRTTPRIKKGKSWKYLDAETVFDWK